LCGLLVEADGAARVRLTQQAEAPFEQVVNDPDARQRFRNLASDGWVGLAVVDVIRCSRQAPGESIRSAHERLLSARPDALPSRATDIDETIKMLDGAECQGVVERKFVGELASSLGALVMAACGLPAA
jgi:hypothetical protein